MRKAFAVLLVLAGLVMVATGFSVAASAAETVNVTFQNQSRQVLTVDNTTVDFGDVTPGVDTPGDVNPAVGVKSNVLWDLDYTAGDFSDGSGGTIVIGRMSWDDSTDSGTFATSGTFYENQGRTGNFSREQVYTLNLDWADPVNDSADFTTQVVYTLTTH